MGQETMGGLWAPEFISEITYYITLWDSDAEKCNIMQVKIQI